MLLAGRTVAHRNPGGFPLSEQALETSEDGKETPSFPTS